MSGKVKFFKKAHFFWIAAITGGMTLLGLCHYSPDSVPHKDLRKIFEIYFLFQKVKPETSLLKIVIFRLFSIQRYHHLSVFVKFS